MRIFFAVCALLLASQAHAEFSPRRIRYVSSYDVIGLMFKNFPGHSSSGAVDKICQTISNSNREVLGGSNSVSGQPLMERPNPGFLRWLNQCLAQYTKFEFTPIGGSYRAGFAKEYLPKDVKINDLGQFMKKPWSSISEKHRAEILETIAVKLIGPPEVFTAYMPGENWSTFTTSIAKTAVALTPADASVATAMATLAHTIFLRDEFLRY